MNQDPVKEMLLEMLFVIRNLRQQYAIVMEEITQHLVDE